MANPEHLQRLTHDVAAWNRWRRDSPDVLPDLSGAILLYMTDLGEANLEGANLTGAMLGLGTMSGATLRRADLRKAILDRLDLSEADLREANLSETDLSRTILREANLSGAMLSRADLYRVDLSGATLSGATLSGAMLSGTDLSKADLSEADLSQADLSQACLYEANLSRACLYRASLREAHLSRANFHKANLREADLSWANLSRTNLRGADLHESLLFHTIFAWVDLRMVEGLDAVSHKGSSIVDVRTVTLPQDEIGMHFLRGAGFSDRLIDFLPSLHIDTAVYDPCFIRYAQEGDTLVRHLYQDLQDKGVRCWVAPLDSQVGMDVHRDILDALHAHEKVLLLLSDSAIQNRWVAQEVETALGYEARGERRLLFPMRLDQAILNTQERWAVRLRESCPIGDLTHWHDDATYQQRLADLLRHLTITRP